MLHKRFGRNTSPLSLVLAASRGAILSAVLLGCRNATETVSGALTIVPSTQGANGCSGPDQVFTPPQLPVAVALTTLVIGPASQVTATGSGEMLYATGDGGQVVAIDVSTATPAEIELVPAGAGPGTVAELLVAAGIATPPVVSGLAVLDADRLVLVEKTSNTLLAVQRMPPFAVTFFAGQPNEAPGFADGLASGGVLLARFSFGLPCQVCPTGEVPPKVFVADAGNHAVRLVQADSSGISQVVTIAGHGLPYFNDGDLGSALFDTPTGLSAACNGLLLVSERGDGTPGLGQRIRQLEIGRPSPFGGFFGTATTIAGDGTDVTTGKGGWLGAPVARVSQPVSPLVTSQGEIYWIDSGSGVLRRMKTNGNVDCPLDVDCGNAVANPTFPAGHDLSLTQTAGGVLFVMDATAGTLYRVTP
jgi:hypothetical protein